MMMIRNSALHYTYRSFMSPSYLRRWSSGQRKILKINLCQLALVSPLCSTNLRLLLSALSRPHYSKFTESQRLVQINNLDGEKFLEPRDRKYNAAINPISTKKRLWKEVHVQEIKDKRPLRGPNSKILTIPSTKPHLATAIALEWELLTSTQQGLKQHMIPLTILSSRALDIIDSDISVTNQGALRTEIVDSLLRYLDTDSLLCWEPMPSVDLPGYEKHLSRVEPLRILQQRTAQPILAFLEGHVWPGVKIEPALDKNNIFPKTQSSETHQVIRRWVHSLSAWNLCALERGVLAGKGLLTAVRLLVEWSEDFSHLLEGEPRNFGIEEAATAASLEVEWQVNMWGVVEDTHDVEREDLRRQFGSLVILVSGCSIER